MTTCEHQLAKALERRITEWQERINRSGRALNMTSDPLVRHGYRTVIDMLSWVIADVREDLKS